MLSDDFHITGHNVFSFHSLSCSSSPCWPELLDNFTFWLSYRSSKWSFLFHRIPLDNCTGPFVVYEPLQCVWPSRTSVFVTLQSCPSLHPALELPLLQMCSCNDIPSMDFSIALCTITSSYSSFCMVSYLLLVYKIAGKILLWRNWYIGSCSALPWAHPLSW